LLNFESWSHIYLLNNVYTSLNNSMNKVNSKVNAIGYLTH